MRGKSHPSFEQHVRPRLEPPLWLPAAEFLTDSRTLIGGKEDDNRLRVAERLIEHLPDERAAAAFCLHELCPLAGTKADCTKPVEQRVGRFLILAVYHHDGGGIGGFIQGGMITEAGCGCVVGVSAFRRWRIPGPFPGDV